jgi:SulP family sulfate permease
VGLGLLAFAPLAGDLPVAALALWSAALPGALLTLLLPRAGVVYAPTTVVALLFAAVVSTVMGTAGSLGLGGAQVLAVCGATVALAFLFQWLFGMLRLASLARFLPISVTHGFAAGVGLSMVLGQVRNGFGSAGWAWDGRLVLHAACAFAVAGLAWLLQRRWPRVPGLLPAVLLVSLLILASGQFKLFNAAASASVFALPPLPDFAGVPWLALLHAHGTQLVSLALLMAVVNSLEILVFNQELDLEYGLRSDVDRALRRESLIGALCGLAGLIPASTSASRSRIALAQAGVAGGAVGGAGAVHAAIMLGVAVTGHWWLHWVPMACLAGGLILAGLMQVPRALWSRSYARSAPSTWTQSWLVAMIFATAGGVGALLAGLVVAIFVLLHSSASSAMRRALVDGQLRSRRLRRAASDAWLTPRMNRVAVFELQGVMSFGVAAHMAAQVRQQVQPRHQWVILDASRVPAWDTTALVQLGALNRDLSQRGLMLAVCGLDDQARKREQDQMRVFADLDRALEWAEEAMLDERPSAQRPAYPEHDLLGEVGEGLDPAARSALESLMKPYEVLAHAQVFEAGETQADLLVLQSGRITLATAWPPETGLRLAAVGQGMAFGEMAFLNGMPRTACAGAEDQPAVMLRLARSDFDSWSVRYPQGALVLMSNLAQVGTRRLAATTRQLRAVLE